MPQTCSVSPAPAAPALRCVLARLEVPPCSCPFQWASRAGAHNERLYQLLPCPHTEAAPDHQLSIGEWAELLRAAQPQEYSDPPLPTRPTQSLSQSARVEVYRRRQAAGQHLYHPQDASRDQERLGLAPAQQLRANSSRLRDRDRTQLETQS